MAEKKIILNPVGLANANEREGKFEVVIKKKFRPALKELEKFSHVNVIWWANNNDTPELRKVLKANSDELPPFYGKEAPDMGIFATRSEFRPNPIAISSLQILNIDLEEGIIKFPWFDMFDGTPIIDLKPYIPMSDLLKSADVPKYLQHWPKNNEDAAQWWAEQMSEM
ncbi:MAG: SAM-dependent methyltransferase [archaeon]|nr:SAM-dependent methyltransferase [archaeon]